jgi:hypothetical protein
MPASAYTTKTVFIGRVNLINEILTAAEQMLGMKELTGRSGVGKTTILKHLVEVNPSDVRPLLVDMEEFNPGHHGESGDRASVGAVQGSFQQFTSLLESLIRQTCAGDALAQFQAEIITARHTEVLGRKVPSLEASMAGLKGDLELNVVAKAWRAAAHTVADHFVSHWNTPTGNACRILLIDNVDEVADQEMGAWLSHLLPRLERTFVVLTLQEPNEGLPSLCTDVDCIPNFGIADIKAYLEDRAPVRVSDPDVRKIYEVTDLGHPATVAIVLNLLWRCDSAQVPNLHELLGDLPEQRNERVAVLAERLVERLDDAAMTEALWAAAVPRSFDAELLRSLLAGMPNDDIKRVVRRMFDRSDGFPFIEVFHDPALLRIHPYVRKSLLDRMARLDAERLHTLHERAAEYYGGRLTATRNYGSMFNYEDPGWQRDKRAWLYHLAHASNEEVRRKALLECSRVFLDAFWWWGSYIRFDFCDQIVDDLDRLAQSCRAPVSDSRQAGRDADARPNASTWPYLEMLCRALRRIISKYPVGSEKPKDADWNDVRDALLEVQEVCGLQRRVGRPLKEDQRHVAALLDVFLAHTWCYRDPECPEADKFYDRAAALFDANNDWSSAWVAFERADLSFKRGEVDAVSAFWLKAAEKVQPHEETANEEKDDDDDWADDELISNLHRLRGDCCWVSGERRRAAAWYGRAVLHSYLFHFTGGPPDEYTLQFYLEIRARALNRLLELWKNDKQDMALDCAEEMARVCSDAQAQPVTRDKLRQLFVDGKIKCLADALFPCGPELSDLGQKISPFATLFRRRYDALDQSQAYADLHDEAWP